MRKPMPRKPLSFMKGSKPGQPLPRGDIILVTITANTSVLCLGGRHNPSSTAGYQKTQSRGWSALCPQDRKPHNRPSEKISQQARPLCTCKGVRGTCGRAVRMDIQ